VFWQVRIFYQNHRYQNNGGRFFLIFEAQYPNPELKKGKAGCFAVADFWKEIGGMNKTEALAQLEKFFYQGLNSLSFGIDIGFKFSKLPWTVNECVRTHLTCAVSVVSEVNGCR
jgi:hypothetical protein